MKSKILIGFFIVLVSTIMLMSNAYASNGIIWANQATLSPIDGATSQDPENSGFAWVQAVVWEEWNAINNNWDIHLKYSLADGAPGTWVFPAVQPATSQFNERYPAVAVTNNNPNTGSIEIHVVYQRWNNAGGGQWDIYHTYTTNFGINWFVPIGNPLDIIQIQDAVEPAIVYTEDLNFPGAQFGQLIQIVWSEFNPGTGIYEIYYNAYYFDPTLIPMRGYIGPALIRGGGVGGALGHCHFPEIASVDETLNPVAYDYYFSVVWQEPIWDAINGRWQSDIWYNDGTTTTSGGVPGIVLTPGSLGKISANVVGTGDCLYPDIAATQDYVVLTQFWYYHVTWVYRILGPPVRWQIDTCFAAVFLPNPGFAAFILTATPSGAMNFGLDNPTIASKLVAVGVPPNFESWICWEDTGSVPATAPDIFYNVGQYTRVPPPGFGWLGAAAIVPYIQPPGATEVNPELWNRNDVLRPFPPLTHLVFDMTQGGIQEVEYIDP